MKIYIKQKISKTFLKYINGYQKVSVTNILLYSTCGLYTIKDNNIHKLIFENSQVDVENIFGLSLIIDKTISKYEFTHHIPLLYSEHSLSYDQYILNDKLRINIYNDELACIETENIFSINSDITNLLKLYTE